MCWHVLAPLLPAPQQLVEVEPAQSMNVSFWLDPLGLEPGAKELQHNYFNQFLVHTPRDQDADGSLRKLCSFPFVLLLFSGGMPMNPNPTVVVEARCVLQTCL